MSSKPTYEELERRCQESVVANNARLEVLVQVLQHQGSTAQAFLDFALDQAIELTGSRIGYIYWYDEGRREFVLNTWSKSVMKECTINDPQTRYELDKTGIWGEAVRQRRPMILNDFQSDHPLKRGCPAGHARLHKFLTVPVFSGPRIVAVVGVANKEADYDTTDVLQLTLLMDGVWKTVEQKQGQEELRKTEERRRLALQGADLGTWDWDAVTGATTFNRRWAEMLGYELSELQPNVRAWEALVHPDDTPGVMHTLKAHLDGRTDSYETEHRMRHKSGRWVWVLDKGRVIERDAQGRALRVCGTHLDVTGRKQAEEAIHLHADQFASILSTTTAGFWLLDESGRLLDVNENYCRMSGYTREELLALRISDLEAAETGAQTERHMRKLIAEGSDRFETRHRTLDGRAYDVEVSTSHWKKGGRVIAFVRDITERKQAEEAQRTSQQLIEGIVQTIPARVFWKDKDLVYRGCNQAFAQDAGLADSKDIIGRDDYQLGWRDQAEVYRRDDREVIAMGRPKLLIEEPQTTPEGKEITILTSKAPLRNSEGDIVGVIGTYIDITERIRAEKEAMEGEERNRRLVESSTDAIIIRSSDNEQILYANPAAIQLFRANCAEEIAGRSYLDLVHPDDRVGTVERINRCREGLWTAPPREHRVLTLSGEVVDVESTGVPVLHQGETQIFGIFRDITERKKAYQEKEKLEVQLRQAQKMEAIGTLAGGIAHDFNNILSVIIGNSELLAIRDEASPSLREGVEQILTAAQRAKQLVSQILTFSRQGEQEKLLVNLKPVVKETLGFLRASLPATIQLRHYIAPDAGVIIADPTQMQQILMNLCTNAAHAMEAQGGVLKIDLGNVTIDKADGSRDAGVASGNYVALTVSDTGHGMEPWVQARIFDPYFTTKEPGKGTGLGLAVVHGIVRSHGGVVQVFSEVGKGTTFKVFLPRAEGVEAARPETSRVLPRGTEKILLVDDEAGLAELGKRMLALLGYQVEARTSPVAALEVFRADPEKFDAVITDMTMPLLTGLSLAREILAIRPEIPIILCTGFSDSANEEKARSAGIRTFLFKPLIMQDLATAVREVLDGPAGGKPPEQPPL